jgi:hypothetical protein
MRFGTIFRLCSSKKPSLSGNRNGRPWAIVLYANADAATAAWFAQAAKGDAMSMPRAPQSAKLVVGIFVPDKHLLREAIEPLQAAFGDIDMVSPWFDFDFTDYYASEMGRPLYRRVVVFKTLIQQDALAAIKCRTNEIERRFSENGKRRINIDPGYMLLERFVLATGKNFTHRIYIGQGIYADLTLIYQKGDFKTLPWTYPDYATSEMRSFLTLVRQKYAVDRIVEADA